MVDAVRLGIGAAADNLGKLLPCRVELSHVTAWAETVGWD
jgi:hypothetical protein